MVGRDALVRVTRRQGGGGTWDDNQASVDLRPTNYKMTEEGRRGRCSEGSRQGQRGDEGVSACAKSKRIWENAPFSLPSERHFSRKIILHLQLSYLDFNHSPLTHKCTHTYMHTVLPSPTLFLADSQSDSSPGLRLRGEGRLVYGVLDENAYAHNLLTKG